MSQMGSEKTTQTDTTTTTLKMKLDGRRNQTQLTAVSDTFQSQVQSTEAQIYHSNYKLQIPSNTYR